MYILNWLDCKFYVIFANWRALHSPFCSWCQKLICFFSTCRCILLEHLLYFMKFLHKYPLIFMLQPQIYFLQMINYIQHIFCRQVLGPLMDMLGISSEWTCMATWQERNTFSSNFQVYRLNISNLNVLSRIWGWEMQSTCFQNDKDIYIHVSHGIKSTSTLQRWTYFVGVNVVLDVYLHIWYGEYAGDFKFGIKFVLIMNVLVLLTWLSWPPAMLW